MSDTHSVICFCEENYKQYYDYSHKKEVNETAMWDDIKEFMRVAVKNGYQMKVSFDGLTVIIEYDYVDGSMSGASLVWLGENEYVGSYTEDAKYNEAHVYDSDTDGAPGICPCD